MGKNGSTLAIESSHRRAETSDDRQHPDNEVDADIEEGGPMPASQGGASRYQGGNYVGDYEGAHYVANAASCELIEETDGEQDLNQSECAGNDSHSAPRAALGDRLEVVCFLIRILVAVDHRFLAFSRLGNTFWYRTRLNLRDPVFNIAFRSLKRPLCNLESLGIVTVKFDEGSLAGTRISSRF